ncbi:MAG: DAK2 domain-containing protein [Spirochaetales bacterium]|jgi:uncharacterized protein|nr:DAK2 domain-containing protein [Spirochaetales bacterium]
MNGTAIERINPESLKNSLAAGGSYLELNSKVLDNLNVFPVPDGDTGVNMVATMKSGIRAIHNPAVSSLADISEHLTGSFSENSRGNSGFILAQFFSGFFDVVKDLDFIDSAGFVSGFSAGSYLARTSLFSPVEGTMITIMSAMVDEMARIDSTDIAEYLYRALDAGRRKIFETPDILPILARAGVVDSGGLGFLFFIEGMLQGITGLEPESVNEDDYRFAPIEGETASSEELVYRFCTEVTVDIGAGGDIDSLKVFLSEHGNSIALMSDDHELRLHIHTNDPKEIISRVEQLGDVKRTKIDDMKGQISALSPAAGTVECCDVLAVVPGEGFADIFRDLGAAAWLVYEKSLPSTGEISDVLVEMAGENIIILPNDGNIIPAATLVRDRSEKNVVVVPTANVVQGISAMYSYLDDMGVEENLTSMSDGMADAEQIRLFRSVRDAKFGTTQLAEGEYFVIRQDEILAGEPDGKTAVINALKSINMSGRASITCFYGGEAGEKITREISAALTILYEDIEFESVYGGQQNSLLTIAIE